MRPFLERVRAGEVLLADGAIGTQLMAAGLEAGHCPETLNRDRPDLLADVARSYAEAGSDFVVTNTFGATPIKLEHYGLSGETEALNAAAVAAARRGAGEGVYVGGCVGPTGKLLEPYGDAKPEAVYEAYVRQVRALLEAGVDLLCVETMTDLAEATLAVRAARSLHAELPITATMTFDLTPRGAFTIMGVDVPGAIAGLTEAGADVVGSNCGNGSETMVEIAREFLGGGGPPVFIQANAGLPETRGGEVFYPESPETMAAELRSMLDLGVALVGGCCGTSPDHIRAFRAVLDSRS